MTIPPDSEGRTALVLGSGGARAAYEVGVARFIFEDLHRALHRLPRLDFICGTSAGALNALALAAFADQPLSGVALLARRWTEIRLADVVRVQPLEVMRLTRALLGCPPSASRAREGQGGILDPRFLRRRVFAGLPVARLAEHIRRGHLAGVSLTATEVATGRTALFLQTAGPVRPVNRTCEVIATILRPEHALASAAIPLLFPPVRIGRRVYCDGSLRQSVPLSPALHLGASQVVAVSTQYCPQTLPGQLESEREEAVASPLYLLGKAVNALTLDRIDDDLERLALVNQIIDAGMAAFGPRFLVDLNRVLALGGGRTIQPVNALLIRPSESLGRLAAEHVRSRGFRVRVRGAVGRTFSRLAEAESRHEADLLSYLLFDGAFAATLMELGYHDARRQQDELAALFEARAAAAPRAA